MPINSYNHIPLPPEDTLRAMHTALKQYEGFSETPYRDGPLGGSSVGYGHHFGANTPALLQQVGADADGIMNHAPEASITREQARRILHKYDVPKHLVLSRRLFPTFNNEPPQLQSLLLSGAFRGEFARHHNTVKAMQPGGEGWEGFLRNYREGRRDYNPQAPRHSGGVENRMDQAARVVEKRIKWLQENEGNPNPNPFVSRFPHEIPLEETRRHGVDP